MDGGIEVILGELIEMVQATAPTLWAIARRQVLTYRVSFTLWATVFFLIAATLGLVARHSARLWQSKKKKGEHRAYNCDDWTPQNTMWFAGCIAVITLIASYIFLHSLIMYSINPDYYAIKVLLELVR